MRYCRTRKSERRNPGRMQLVLQAEKTECGLACLAMVASPYTPNISMRWLRSKYPTSMRGTSLPRLAEISSELGLQTKLYAAQTKALGNLDDPCILFVDDSHFVVLRGKRKRCYQLYDPAIGAISLNEDELGRRFSGYLLRVTSGVECTEVPRISKAHWKVVGTPMKEAKQSYIRIATLTVLFEIAALLSPLYAQKVFDQLYSNTTNSTIATLSIAFLAIAVGKFTIGITRAFAIAKLGASLLSQLSITAFGKLLSLPPEYFLKRYPAETISRLGSLHHLQELISSKLIEAAIDAIAAIVLVAICALYDPLLGLLALLGVLSLIILRLLMAPRIHGASSLLLSRSARQDGEVMETIRAAQTVKMNGIEKIRLRRFTERQRETTEASINIQRLTIATSYASDLIFNIVRITIIYWGALRVTSGELTAGALIATAFYTEMLYQRANSLVPKLMDLKLAGLHLERISDVMLEISEPAPSTQSSLAGTGTRLAVGCSGLGFRYSTDDRWIFRGLDMEISAGEAVAIVGPSGLGKSTFLKIISGLFPSVEGTFFVNGKAIQSEDLGSLRRVVSTVMQQDALLSGTILENVTFNEATPDIPWVWECLAVAHIDQFIQDLPMGLHTHVGEGGALLSGGQQQRILLARALYRKPAILILDEATSQIDYATEKEINHSLSNLKMTRIIATHRTSTLPKSVRVVNLGAVMEEATR